MSLTHWGRMTHICVGKLTIIGSDNGLSPGRRQAIIWTNAGILLIGNLGTNFSEILIAIEIFSFKKMHLKMSSAKWRPLCLGFNVLNIDPCWLVESHQERRNVIKCWPCGNTKIFAFSVSMQNLNCVPYGITHKATEYKTRKWLDNNT